MAGKKTGKRLLTWVLVLVMALSLLPLNALAAEADEAAALQMSDEDNSDDRSLMPAKTTYTITFDANGGTFADGTVEYVGKYSSKDATVWSQSPKDNPTRPPYVFEGWYKKFSTIFGTIETDVDIKNDTVKDVLIWPSTSRTLYAKWSPPDNWEQASIFYLKDPTKNRDSNTGEDWSGPLGGKEAGFVDTTSLVFTKSDTPGSGLKKVENSWDVQPNDVTWPTGFGKPNANGLELDKDSTVWNDIFEAFKEKVEKDNGVGSLTADQVDSITLVPYKVSRGNQTDGSYHVDCDVVIECNFVTVDFMVKNDSNVFVSILPNGKMTCPKGQAFQGNIPTAPKKDGYEFDDWYKDKEYTQTADFNTALTTDTTFYGKYTEKETPNPEPANPELGVNFNFDKNIVDVICETTSNHNASYRLMNGYYTVSDKTQLTKDKWQCTITIDLAKYFELYNSDSHHPGHTRDMKHEKATAIKTIYPTWSAKSRQWSCAESLIDAAEIYVKCDAVTPPTEPSKEEVKKLLGDNAVQIICTNDKATHTPTSKGYALIEDSYTSDGVKGDAENGYTYTVTIKSEKYVNQFDTDTGAVHTPKNATATVTLEYKNNAWLVKSVTPISFNVVCDAAPAYPVYVYAFFAHDDDPPLKGEVTVNGKKIEWNENSANGQYFVTLGVYQNGTTQEPTNGATGLVLKDLNVTEYEAATSQGNGTKNGVTLTDITGFPYPYGKVCSGAAGYPESEGKLSWHLDGQVDVYTVTYDDGMTEGEPTSDGYYFRSYTIADAPTKRDGYTFTGWKDDNGDVYQAGDEIKKLNKDLNLVAQWTARTDLSYTVNYLEKDTNIVLHEKKIQTGVTFGAEIDSADEIITINGYNYDSADKDKLTIGTDESKNVINIYYTKRTDLSYTVHYYLKNTTKPVANDKRVNGQTFNAVVKEEAIRISGYRVYGDSVKSITIDTGTNEIIFYYTRASRPSTPSKPTLNTGDHYAYVMGYPDGTVRPNGSITRAEVSAILFRLLSDKTRDEYFTTESSFTDVKAGAWYNNSIATLEKAGVIVDTAKGGAFRPNEAITRAELAAMLAQFSDAKPVKGVKFSDVSAEHWAYEAIAIAAKMGWIEGYPDGTFRPDATITRAEMMTLVNRALERVPSDEDHLLSKRVMLTFPDCKSGDWFYIAVQEATNSHTYERAATEKNGDEQWTALRANRDWTQLEK